MWKGQPQSFCPSEVTIVIYVFITLENHTDLSPGSYTPAFTCYRWLTKVICNFYHLSLHFEMRFLGVFCRCCSLFFVSLLFESTWWGVTFCSGVTEILGHPFKNVVAYRILIASQPLELFQLPKVNEADRFRTCFQPLGLSSLPEIRHSLEMGHSFLLFKT